MPFVSVTRLRIRARRFLPSFFWFTLRAVIQARRAPGCLSVRLGIGSERTYWTMTLWASEADMQVYRSRGAHLRVMPYFVEWASEGAVVHWEHTDRILPSFAEAAERLLSAGRLSKVHHPTPAHSSGEPWPDGRLPYLAFVLLSR
jgi:heme-degrading monooxygenase HmoA